MLGPPEAGADVMPRLPHELVVLIVDDSREDREFYKRLLGKDRLHTYRFSEAESGAEGLELCRKGDFHCLLLDYRLPDLDGLELLRELARGGLNARIPVVMLSGAGTE